MDELPDPELITDPMKSAHQSDVVPFGVSPALGGTPQCARELLFLKIVTASSASGNSTPRFLAEPLLWPSDVKRL